MEDQRPNPNTILNQLNREESGKTRGKLKIFFGYAAGVGKTFAMLEAAHTAMNAGVDVVAGYIEPHTRPETLALLEGLEQLAPLQVAHKGVSLREFDLDGAIRRKPQLILVDELAHTNAGGSRHIKRYQDIEELLQAGISVYTTVNVQHLESLNDIVATITRVTVRERIPDRIFDQADQVELVDIEPDDLIERLNEGKIYREQQAQRALSNFFVRENLMALREIALRRTADRLTKKGEQEKRPEPDGTYYSASEHILICLSSSPSNAKVIRTAARMAAAFHGSFTALFVETPNSRELSDDNRGRLRENLKLAESLGAKIATAYGDDVPYQIAEYAKASGISKIVLGRSARHGKWVTVRSGFVDRLTDYAPNLDVYIIPDNLITPQKKKLRTEIPAFSAADTIKMLLILTAATAVGFWFYYLGFGEANIITVYILGVLCTALVTDGKMYSGVSSVVSVLLFNYFFTDPRYTLQAHDINPVTFVIMFAAALLSSTLTVRVKLQARQSAQKAQRTEVLLQTSQKLQRAKNLDEIMQETLSQLQKLLNRTVIIYPADGASLKNPRILALEDSDGTHYIGADERAVADWVYKNNKHAGATTNTLPGAKCLYMAVRSHETVFAVVAIAMEDCPPFDTFEKNLMLAMLAESALAMEKEKISDVKNQISMQAERERLRSNLLRAISHDLRTPLTSISGNAGMLMGNSSVLDETQKHQLYEDIYDDSMWLINLVENLLSVTRIDNGQMDIHMQPELLDEVISEALRHINRKSAEHKISVNIEDDLLMAKMDSRLIIQVIINIVDNAIKYTRPGSEIVVASHREGELVWVEIGDNGDGIPDSDKEKLFDMFFTSGDNKGDGRRGLGLGLSLCKSILSAHGGKIAVRDNRPKGTIFSFTLRAEEVKTNV